MPHVLFAGRLHMPPETPVPLANVTYFCFVVVEFMSGVPPLTAAVVAQYNVLIEPAVIWKMPNSRPQVPPVQATPEAVSTVNPSFCRHSGPALVNTCTLPALAAPTKAPVPG